MLPALAERQAAGKVSAILTAEGEKPEPVSLGGYRITLVKGRTQGSAQSPTSAAGAELPGNVAMGSRAMANDMRPFALVVHTAPDEFLVIGSNGDPTSALDSPGPARVAIAAKDEGRFE